MTEPDIDANVRAYYEAEYERSAAAEDILPLDPTCPYCGGHFGGGDGFDGSEFNCGNCGRLIVVCEWTDGTMSMIKPTPDPFANQRTGRQRTRALWRRRGRR